MADATYVPKVYRKQGGDEIVVASGGAITVESGGSIAVQTGGTVNTRNGTYNMGALNVIGVVTATVANTSNIAVGSSRFLINAGLLELILPTSDPARKNAVWCNSGVLTINTA